MHVIVWCAVKASSVRIGRRLSLMRGGHGLRRVEREQHVFRQTRLLRLLLLRQRLRRRHIRRQLLLLRRRGRSGTHMRSKEQRFGRHELGRLLLLLLLLLILLRGLCAHHRRDSRSCDRSLIQITVNKRQTNSNSCQTFAGGGDSSPPRDEERALGPLPFPAHLFFSYLARINCSI